MKTVLGIISTELNSIGVPYEFMEWTDPVQYQYWVGEFTEVPVTTEDGHKEISGILTGTTKGSWLELEEARAKIEEHFPGIYGLRKSTGTGAIVIYYENSFPVPTGEADLKRLQVNLKIKQWKGVM